MALNTDVFTILRPRHLPCLSRFAEIVILLMIFIHLSRPVFSLEIVRGDFGRSWSSLVTLDRPHQRLVFWSFACLVKFILQPWRSNRHRCLLLWSVIWHWGHSLYSVDRMSTFWPLSFLFSQFWVLIFILSADRVLQEGGPRDSMNHLDWRPCVMQVCVGASKCGMARSYFVSARFVG